MSLLLSVGLLLACIAVGAWVIATDNRHRRTESDEWQRFQKAMREWRR